MIDHRIHVAAGHDKAKLRFSKDCDTFRVFPVRLGNDTDTVSVRFQYSTYNSMSKRGMIYIGIADDIDKV